MEKLKITEIKSKEYEKGRIDFFKIEGKKEIHKEICSLLNDLEFPSEKIEDLDFNYLDGEGSFFTYSKGIRFNFFINENNISFSIDSKKTKKEIISVIENYFLFFLNVI